MGISKEYSKWSDKEDSGWLNREPANTITQSSAICVIGPIFFHALSLSNDPDSFLRT